MFLMELEATIEDLGADVYKLDATQLKKLNVNLCDMTLDPNSEFNPRFFASRLNLPQPSDEILDEACSPISRGYDDSYLDAYSTHIYWNLYALHNIAFEDGSPWRLKW